MLTEKWLANLPLPPITQVTPVGGGDVNAAYRVATTQGTFFLLVQAHQPASFYAGEIAGLKAFTAAKIRAPRVIAHGQSAGDAYLILSYLEPVANGDQSALGALVAKLHAYASPTGRFGFSQPYAGTSVSFANPWSDSWAELFINQRLDVLDAALVAKHRWAPHQRTDFLQVRAVISRTLAAYPSQPVLLHGDLWSGNYMFTPEGPALIDPAAWYGDAEFDLAITTVFGGFSSAFYQAYQHAHPLAAGFSLRQHFYRLYYLMVHLDKFGSGYSRSVQAELDAILA
ncbi:fructosamine kinase family protein [Lacticaseibacillus baoqingensis]|uniref:Fructosamine kinase family protein n=1 Tax=Lacticaseibacillus baoqingensis TaxID=2486013 RepID=A0ABW4EAK8_9LACO|nr:fructosamine kinase family protein [Lacticaseibacillus baoqingensis]